MTDLEFLEDLIGADREKGRDLINNLNVLLGGHAMHEVLFALGASLILQADGDMDRFASWIAKIVMVGRLSHDGAIELHANKMPKTHPTAQ